MSQNEALMLARFLEKNQLVFLKYNQKEDVDFVDEQALYELLKSYKTA